MFNHSYETQNRLTAEAQPFSWASTQLASALSQSGSLSMSRLIPLPNSRHREPLSRPRRRARNGSGEHHISVMEAEATNLGATELYVAARVHQSNLPSRRLIQAAGFEPDDSVCEGLADHQGWILYRQLESP